MGLPTVSSPRPRDIDWRWAIPRIALVFLVTRLLALGVAVAVEATQPPPPPGIRVDERPILASLTAWDGTYYLGIAEDGYDAKPDPFPEYAFYPLFPVATTAASVLTRGDVSLAGVLVGNAAFALALVALYALSVRHLEPDRAVLSLWFLALSPGAIAFSLSYSESLFLLFAVGAFLAAETRRPWSAGAAVALATLARPTGILLLLPLAVILLQQHGWRIRAALRDGRAWLPLALAPMALAAFFGYVWWLTGDPLGAISAQSYWNQVAEPASVAAAGTAVDATGEGPTMGNLAGPQAVVLFWVASLAFYAFLLVFFRPDRIGPAYVLLAVMAIVSVFVSGRLQSAPRYLAVAWPFDWVLAGRRSQFGRGAVLGTFAVLHVVLLWLAFTWSVPP